MNYDKLNPGIRKTVQWLQEQGYNTIDSGDGKTAEYECDIQVPYVHIKVHPTSQAHYHTCMLALELKDKGISLDFLDEVGKTPAIIMTYNPAEPFAIISLYNVDDNLLFPNN